MPEAVKKPEMTGWLKKLLKKPIFNRPMTTSIPPEISESIKAACKYVSVPVAATDDSAAPVIKAIMATGPTARVLLVPNCV